MTTEENDIAKYYREENERLKQEILTLKIELRTKQEEIVRLRQFNYTTGKREPH